MESASITVPLCRLNDIPDPGGKGFTVSIAGRQQEIFVVRRGNHVYGYINSCPHTGVCLDWQPDQFLTTDNSLIVCSMHGALFRLEDGYCMAGPCAGDSLEAIRISVKDALVVLESD